MTALGETIFCEARRFGDTMHCGRCELAFAPDAGRLPCKPAAQCGLTAGVIRDAIERAADDLGASIDAASRAAMRGPDGKLLRREAALRAGLRMIDQQMQVRKGNP